MLPIETTPKALSPKIAEFLPYPCTGSAGRFSFRFSPPKGQRGTMLWRTWPNYAAQFGGATVLGWCIWERPGINLHATFHTVWKSWNGELIDVTPKPDGEARILFLPDPTLVWEGKRIEGHFARCRTGGKSRIS